MHRVDRVGAPLVHWAVVAPKAAATEQAGGAKPRTAMAAVHTGLPPTAFPPGYLLLLLLLLTPGVLTRLMVPPVGVLTGAKADVGLPDKNNSRALWILLSTPLPFLPTPTPRVARRDRITAVHCMQSHVSSEPWGAGGTPRWCRRAAQLWQSQVSMGRGQGEPPPFEVANKITITAVHKKAHRDTRRSERLLDMKKMCDRS